MKVLLHGGDEIREYEIGEEPPERIASFNGDFVRSGKKADGMPVYYQFDLGEQLLRDAEEQEIWEKLSTEFRTNHPFDVKFHTALNGFYVMDGVLQLVCKNAGGASIHLESIKEVLDRLSIPYRLLKDIK